MHVHPSVFTDPLAQALGLVREIIGLPPLPSWEQVKAKLAHGEQLGVLLPFSDIALVVEDMARDWDGLVVPHADPRTRFFAVTQQRVAQVEQVVASRD